MSPDRTPDLEGDFSRYPFPRLLYFLAKKTFLGELAITPPSGKKVSVYFRDGFPVYTDLLTTEDILGRVLLERGWIDDTAFNASMMRLAQGHKRQGQILLEMGALTEPRLVEGLTIQLRRKLNRLFFPRNDSFSIWTGDHSHGQDGEASAVRADPLVVIYHGVKNAYDRQRLVVELEKLRGTLVQVRADVSDLQSRYGLQENELALVTLLMRAPLAFSRIAAVSHLGDVETLMLVYTLWTTEALIVVGRETTEVAPVQAALPSPSGPATAPAGSPQKKPPVTPTLASPAHAARQPRPATTPASAEQSQQHRQAIAQAHAKLARQNHFEVLGLVDSCTVEDVRTAYFKLARDFHPDRTAALGTSDLRKKAEDVFRRISEAQSTLVDAVRRKAYQERLAHGDTGEAEVRSALDAEVAFQQGTVLFRKKQFAAALAQFETALKLSPQEGEHLAWVAWTIFSNPETDRARCLGDVKQQLLAAVQLSPKNANCHYFLGELYLAAGDEGRAQTCFSQVVELKPHHVAAQRHLHLIRSRKAKSGTGGGGKTGLFGRAKKK